MIGDRIKERRLELGMTQEDLAALVGYTSRTTINKIELGKNNLSYSKIMQFAKALNLSPTYLMGLDQTSSIPSQSVFCERLNKEMRRQKVRAIDLAKAMDVTEGTISQYRSGYTEPKRERLTIMAEYLHVTPSYLIGLDNAHSMSKDKQEIIDLLEKMDKKSASMLREYAEFLCWKNKGKHNED